MNSFSLNKVKKVLQDKGVQSEQKISELISQNKNLENGRHK